MFSFFKLKYYDSIDDLPINNWIKINETNDLKWLLINNKKEINKKEINILRNIWDKIFEQFIDYFGIPDKMLKVLELKREIFSLNCDLISYSDRSIQTFIDIAQYQLNELQKENSKINFNEIKVYVEKYMGFQINEKKMSVKDYYTYINVINKNKSK